MTIFYFGVKSKYFSLHLSYNINYKTEKILIQGKIFCEQLKKIVDLLIC
jgi:hypothetical protein